MDSGVLIFLLAVCILGVMIFVAIFLNGKRGHAFNKQDYQTWFLSIENRLQQNNTASYTLAVIEGDKLLDKAMMEMGVPGKTMGERLKRAGSKFSNLNAVWRAHKLRNTIAHEANFEITYKQALNAMAIYKQALKDLGAI